MSIIKVPSQKFQVKSKGFTLIEMLVSMALFSIVLVIILGAIMSIVDANRKARSLMTVMNNLNFTVDSMTRSFKTGQNAKLEEPDGSCFSTKEIDYSNGSSVPTRYVQYCFVDGAIKKGLQNKNSELIELTSPDILITNASFEIKHSGRLQPLLIINIQGEVVITPKIRSAFTIQTSVSQRKLQIVDDLD